VIEDDGKRTFDRDDGSQGQVRNIRLKDETGDIRVALWGDKADREIDLADRVLVTDAEIQDGWQDDLEASAGWQSTVSVLESGADTSAGEELAQTTEADKQAAAAAGGLSAFEDGDSPSQSSTERNESSTDASDSTETASTDGDAVEFTGTVVQTGDPVILDDGSETRRVKTAETLRLGEEVTVRGLEAGGTIDADELF